MSRKPWAHDEESIKHFFGDGRLYFVDVDGHCWITDKCILIRMDNTVGWWRRNQTLESALCSAFSKFMTGLARLDGMEKIYHDVIGATRSVGSI